ncbi:MAG: MliC family protein [Candidatus Gribaldobacteria bacterium]|nr:MliC family protein [Candidatus Gribaldobacteria bacterium]
MKKTYVGVVAILLVGVIALAWLLFQKKSPDMNNEAVKTDVLISQVDYQCDGGKIINAKYYQGPKAPQAQPGEMPTPTGSVQLILSDGRQLNLPQTISASGIRYATTSEDLIFWSKGNGAFITENNVQTYSGCIAIVADPGGLPQAYENGIAGFSVRYPARYTVNSSYQYQAMGPGKEINGIKFTIPSEMATGTNLSGFDTGVSVESIANASDCKASLFLDLGSSASTEITDNDIQYSVATSSGAGAGNFYQETVWAMPGTNPCLAIRYFIHSTNIANYPEGVVEEFNRQALIDQFDAIRRTLILSE